MKRTLILALAAIAIGAIGAPHAAAQATGQLERQTVPIGAAGEASAVLRGELAARWAALVASERGASVLAVNPPVTSRREKGSSWVDPEYAPSLAPRPIRTRPAKGSS